MSDLNLSDPVKIRERVARRLTEIREQMAKLEKEAAQLHEDLYVTEQFIEVWRRANNVHGPNQQMITLSHRTQTSVSKGTARNPPKEVVVNWALHLIGEMGRPLSRQDLYDLLRHNGINVYGKNPQMVLSTMLWRSQDRIVRLGNHGYWPKDKRYEPAHYMPEHDDVFRVATPEPEGELEDPDEYGDENA